MVAEIHPGSWRDHNPALFRTFGRDKGADIRMDGVHDHQCGFKTMSREVAEAVLNVSKSDGYFFDTEMIVRCKQLGFPVVEVAVQWAERDIGISKVNPVREAGKMGLDMLAFRLKSKK